MLLSFQIVANVQIVAKFPNSEQPTFVGLEDLLEEEISWKKMASWPKPQKIFNTEPDFYNVIPFYKLTVE